MKSKKDTHEHKYTSMKMQNIVADNMEYDGNAKAFLMFKCKCGDTRAFDYGDRKDLLEKVKTIIAKKQNA